MSRVLWVTQVHNMFCAVDPKHGLCKGPQCMAWKPATKVDPEYAAAIKDWGTAIPPPPPRLLPDEARGSCGWIT